MVWENPKMGELWMLVFHEALYFGTAKGIAAMPEPDEGRQYNDD
jgi:hypothetical protein